MALAKDNARRAFLKSASAVPVAVLATGAAGRGFAAPAAQQSELAVLFRAWREGSRKINDPSFDWGDDDAFSAHVESLNGLVDRIVAYETDDPQEVLMQVLALTADIEAPDDVIDRCGPMISRNIGAVLSS